MSELTDIDVLEFCHGAILDACFSEDGLQGADGTRVLDMIEERLREAGRDFTPWQKDDEGVTT